MPGVALLEDPPEDWCCEPPETPLDCWVTKTLVDPGASPGALPMTSIVVLPPCRAAVPVKTPFPTAADLP